MDPVQQRFMGEDGLPAPIAVGEDIGKADARHQVAGRIDDLVQAARVSEIPVHMGTHFREVIRTGSALRDVRQHLAASVKRTIDVRFFEFIGDHARDRFAIMAVERRRPVLLEFHECSFGSRLILRTLRGKGSRR